MDCRNNDGKGELLKITLFYRKTNSFCIKNQETMKIFRFFL